MPTEVLQRKFAKQFDLFDLDRDGYIERSDVEQLADQMSAAMQTPKNSPKVADLRNAMVELWTSLQNNVNTDSAQRISRDEYVSASGNRDVVAKEVRSAVACFEMMDADGDGRVSLNEWLAVDKKINISRADSERAFRDIDSDGDGYITKAEVTAAFEDYFRNENPSAPFVTLFGSL